MPKITQKSAVALAYARSLLELANERKQAEPIKQELGNMRQIVAENRTFGMYLSDPAIGQTERGDFLKRVFTGKSSPLMSSFLGVLNQKNRLGALSQIADAYDQLFDEQLGKIEVDVTVATRLSKDQLEEVRNRVSTALKKDATVHELVDESIIGGLIVRVQDKLLDASVRTQLAAMKEQMLASRTK